MLKEVDGIKWNNGIGDSTDCRKSGRKRVATVSFPLIVKKSAP
jgi:hypothetical protein